MREKSCHDAEKMLDNIFAFLVYFSGYFRSGKKGGRFFQLLVRNLGIILLFSLSFFPFFSSLFSQSRVFWETKGGEGREGGGRSRRVDDIISFIFYTHKFGKEESYV